MERPQVSYVVPVFNKAPYLQDLFASLSDQLPTGEAEWIFVDDCSTDASAAVLKHIRDGLDGALQSRFLILRTERNSGPAIAINAGLKAASGRYVHFIDADDRLPRNATRLMIAAGEKENAELVYGGHDVLSEQRQTTAENASYKVFEEPLADMLKHKVVGPRFLARSDAIQRSGGADDSIFIQDCSLPWRIAAVSRRVVLLDAVVQEYRRYEGQLSDNRAQEFYDLIGASLAILAEHPELPDDVVRTVHRRCLKRLLRYGVRNWPPRRWLPLVPAVFKANFGRLSASEARAALLAGRIILAEKDRVRGVWDPLSARDGTG